MTLYVYDSSYKVLGIVDDIISMSWVRKFRDVGTMSLEVPYTSKYQSLLKLGNYVTLEGRSGEIRMISYKSYQRKADGTEVIDIQGVDPLDILNRRVFYEETTIIAAPIAAVYKIMDSAIGSTAGDSRIISNFVITKESDSSDAEISEYTFQIGDNARDSILTILQAYDIGIETTYSNGIFTFNIRHSVDKGEDSGHPVVFSSDWGTLGDQTYTDSALDYYNTYYNWYVSLNEDTYGKKYLFITGDENTGINRREAIGKEYEAYGISSAKNKARNDYTVGAAEEEAFTGEINQAGQYKYRTDFDLGDRVVILNKKWDVANEQTITEIEEDYDAGSESIKVTFGDNTITFYDKLVQTMRRARL